MHPDFLRTNSGVDLRVIPFRVYRELYVTFPRADKKTVAGTLRELDRAGARIVKVTGLGDLRGLRKLASLLRPYPFVAVGHSGPAGEDGVSLSLAAVEGAVRDFAYLKHGGEVVGSFFRTAGLEHLFIKSPSRPAPRGATFADEAGRAYAALGRLLKRKGFSSRDIYRCWNYMEDIGRHYAPFNGVRNTYFRKWGITDYPAATGVEAWLPEGRVSLSLEAVKAKRRDVLRITTIRSDLQCEAVCYGPKFSRARILSYPRDGVEKMYISGTSSIDRDGRSVLAGHAVKNIRYVVKRVRHLLEKVGMSPADVVTAAAYFKGRSVQETFRSLGAAKALRAFPSPLVADLCRPELLFEVECLAARKCGPAGTKGE